VGVAVDPTQGLVYVTGTALDYCLKALPNTCILPAAYALLPPATQALYTPVSIGVVCTVAMGTNTELGCYQVGTSPEGVAVNTSLGQVFVANNGDDTVTELSAGTCTPTTTCAAYVAPKVVVGQDYEVPTSTSIPVGPGPMGVAIGLGNDVFVSDNGGNTVSVLQQRTATSYTVTTVTVGFQPAGIAVDPATNDVWVANSGDGTVDVLAPSTYYTVTASIKVGDTPFGVTIFGKNAYITMYGTAQVLPISTSTYMPGTPITVLANPFGIAAFSSPETSLPSFIYVTNSGSNTVSVINPVTGAVVATIVVP